jgi:hypothetical protein
VPGHGHPGIELHNHFFGIVHAEVLRARRKVGDTTSSWVSLLRVIAKLNKSDKA